MIKPLDGYLTIKELLFHIRNKCTYALRYKAYQNNSQLFETLQTIREAASEKRDHLTSRAASELADAFENALKYEDASYLDTISEERIEKLLAVEED